MKSELLEELKASYAYEVIHEIESIGQCEIRNKASLLDYLIDFVVPNDFRFYMDKIIAQLNWFKKQYEELKVSYGRATSIGE